MKKYAAMVALAAAAISTPAFAQDTGDADNGGFFVGALAGYDVINLEDAAGNDFDDTGIVYGVTAGFDIDTGKAILGVEAEISDTSISDDVGDAGLDIYGGLRLGYEMDNDDVLYLKGGYTRVDTDGADEFEGVRLGTGWEHNFGAFMSRVEYRYSNYNVSDVLNADVNGNRHQIVLVLGGKF